MFWRLGVRGLFVDIEEADMARDKVDFLLFPGLRPAYSGLEEHGRRGDGPSETIE